MTENPGSNGMSERSETAPQVAPPASPANNDERNWAMFCHLAALAGYVGVPAFGIVLGPLVVWLIKRNDLPLVDQEGKKALNFQITMLIGYAIAAVLIFAVVGVFLLAALAIANLVFIILASIKTSQGETYEYPYSIRFLH